MAKKSTPNRNPSPRSNRSSQADARLEQAKLAALKELAYGASHEINNPLANIATRAQTLLIGEQDPEKRRALAAIHAQAMRAHEMIADMMLFARPPQLVRKTFSLIPWLERLLDECRTEAAEREIAATIMLNAPANAEGAASPAAETTIDADPVQLAVALRCVLRNSLEALDDQGQISVDVVYADPEWVLTVRDSGRGIPTEILSHVFEPFYSGREAGRGLGFGLAKAWRIVTDHGGGIAIIDPAAGQTTVQISLPVATRPTAS